MRKWIAALLLILVFLPPALAGVYKVAVFDFDDRLGQAQTTAKYIEKRLKEKYPGMLLDQYTGKGDVSLSIDLLKKVDRHPYDLLVIITSDALVIANHVIKNTPTLFTNASNPLFLGFRTLGPPGGKISGASYYISFEKQLALYRQLLPGADRLGFVFDRNNKSRKVELPEVRKVCEKKGIRYRIEVVASEAELNDAASRLVRAGVQALIIGSSDMLYDNIARFLSPCNKAAVPVFSFNKNGVKRGALAALSSDYNLMVDDLIVPMALSVLEQGKSPGEMPIRFLKENRVFINLAQAKALNLTIPDDILEKAITIP